jgi:hypothetical protein
MIPATHTFETLVARCGLSSMFARHAMARAIARCGLTPETLMPSDLARVMSELERAIRPFLGDRDVMRVLGALQRIDEGLDVAAH